MTLPTEVKLLLASQGGYQISRSVRLRSSATAYFNRTLTTPTSGTTWTWSGWVKRGALGVESQLFSAGASVSDQIFFQNSTDVLIVYLGANTLITSQVFRDPSSWYHIVLQVDTTQATASNRVRLYVNGSQVTAFSSTSYPTQNATTKFNSASVHNIGRYQAGASGYFDGYLTEINFIDGQALTPASFGETNTTTGVWQPKKYTGTYGTNGFYLNFSDNTGATATTIGKDYSGNGNNWTPNNISVTAGVTYDSMLDVPTQWADGGNGRGNYCTLNPLTSTNSITVNNGNLYSAASSASGNVIRSTLMNNIGKWYFEATVTFSSIGFAAIGVVLDSQSIVSPTGLASVPAGMWLWRNDAYKVNNGTATAYGTSASSGDIIMIAYDAGAGKIWFGRQGTWFASGDPAAGTNESFSGLTTSIGACVNFQGTIGSSTFDCNFGQRPFSYTPPTGFKALNTLNLPTPTILKGNQYFDATTYTGNGTSQSIVNSGAMQPDFIWIKDRSVASAHALTNSVTGITKYLESNTTLAETTDTTSVTAINSNGFSLGAGTATYYTNRNGEAFVAWQWKANGTPAVTNTAGSITSTISAGATQGFSIVTYTGTGANATVGHGLGVAPDMIIVKRRNATDSWPVYHSRLTSAANTLILNSTAAQQTVTTYWNSTAPTSSVFTVGTDSAVNASGSTYVAYVFDAVAGFSAFGSYTGNGSTDGPFVFCGFRPRFILTKGSSTTGSWWLYDTARSTYNEMTDLLRPDLSNADVTQGFCDSLSNGFKIRNTGNNTSGQTYIFAAFAENPFKNALAR